MDDPIRANGFEVWSLFSGAMGLDLGLEQAGLNTTLANEIDPVYCQTIRANRPNVTLLEGSASGLTGMGMREARKFDGDVFLLSGGPPCQSYSSGGKREAMNDPRGSLVEDFFRIVKEVRPRYFAMENVANLATAAIRHRPIDQRPGKHWSLKKYDIPKQGSFLEDSAIPLGEDELAGSALRRILSEFVIPLATTLRSVFLMQPIMERLSIGCASLCLAAVTFRLPDCPFRHMGLGMA